MKSVDFSTADSLSCSSVNFFIDIPLPWNRMTDVSRPPCGPPDAQLDANRQQAVPPADAGFVGVDFALCAVPVGAGDQSFQPENLSLSIEPTKCRSQFTNRLIQRRDCVARRDGVRGAVQAAKKFVRLRSRGAMASAAARFIALVVVRAEGGPFTFESVPPAYDTKTGVDARHGRGDPHTRRWRP